jgi:hypothetical protein
MTAIAAQLLVASHTYPVRLATYEFTQATGLRGRVTERVRMGLVALTLDVPADDFLVSWAATPNKPLAGQVVFVAAQGGMALETLAWEAGQCVGYREEFVAGDQAVGAYVCHLTIAAPQLTIQPGGVATYSSPEVALIGVPSLVIPPVGPPPTPLVLPTVEELAAVAGEKLLEGLAAAGSVVLTPLVLTLGLILASTTPTAANDTLPHPQVLPIDPKLLRLQVLIARHAAGTLTKDEEAELLSLLGSVKGIHIRQLSDLEQLCPTHPFNGHLIPLRSSPIIIPPYAAITEQQKIGYDQVKFRWTNGPYGYEARWHTRTPGAPATQGDTWVVTRTTPGTAQGQRKVQHILTGPNQWTPLQQWQRAVTANQAGTATQAEQALLQQGHWPATSCF